MSKILFLRSVSVIIFPFVNSNIIWSFPAAICLAEANNFTFIDIRSYSFLVKDYYQPPIVCIRFSDGFSIFVFMILTIPSGFFFIFSTKYFSISYSDFPLRNILLRSYPGFSKRQVNSLPSEVSLILSQLAQKGSVIEEMNPIIPLPSTTEEIFAGAASL